MRAKGMSVRVPMVSELKKALLRAAPVGLLLGVLFYPVQSASAPRPLKAVAVLAVAPLDLDAIRAEDEERDMLGLAPRYAAARHTRITPQTDGTWEDLDAGTRLWRLRIGSPGALSLNLGFTAYHMPPGGQLRIYAADGSHSLRTFTDRDNEEHGQLWTPVVLSDEIVVEVTIPRDVADELALVLTQINVGYRGFDELLGGKSGACNRDVVCPEGEGWRNEIQAVGVISTSPSIGSCFCTGFMVNNTAGNRMPYFMTANHCGIDTSNAASLVVYWNYQASTCGGPRDGKADQAQTGSYFRSTYTASDFTLVLLDDDPDPEWGVAFAGWDRSNSATLSAVGIHHPNCDEKAISFENNPTAITSYYGTSSPGDGTHIRILDWDIGTTEPGSSGSPLFSPGHRVIGQLHGGDAACGNDYSDWYGRFYKSWTGGGSNSTRLSNWLDPGSTGAVTVDTIPPACHIIFTPAAPEIGEPVTFQCESTDPGATITSYSWAFGDATSSTDAAPTHVYASYGTYRVTLTINISGVGTAGCSTTVYVAEPCPCEYTMDDTVAYQWDEIAPTGTPLSLGDDDYAGVAIPFTFTYCGDPYTQVNVGSNGRIHLGTADTLYENACLPSGDSGADRFIAPLWDDLNPTAGGAVYYQVKGTAPNRRLIVEWYDVPHYGGANGVIFQAILYEETGCVLLQYSDVYFANSTYDYGASATIGIQFSGGCAAQYSCELPVVYGGEAILFCPTTPNEPPTCSITYDVAEPTTADLVTFYSNANDPDGTVVGWLWDFGIGFAQSDDPAAYQFPTPGAYTVTCTVTDDDGLTGTCETTVTVTEGPCREYGYEPVPYEWEEISATGTRLLMLDDYLVHMAIPFTFTFCDVPYEMITVCSNGFVYFAYPPLYFTQSCIPGDTGFPVNRFIAPFSDDLNPEVGGSVYYEVRGTAPDRRVIVEWLDVPHYYAPAGNGATFEVVLYEATGCILMQYADTEFGDAARDYGATAVIGIQCTGTCGLQYSCYSQSVFGGEAILYCPVVNQPPEPCFSYDPPSPNDQVPVQFTDCSTDPDGSVVGWYWDFGDGGTSADPDPSHDFYDGTWHVCLTVADDGDPPLEATYCEDITISRVAAVICQGSVCGGPGPSMYQYEVTAAAGLTFDYWTVGTDDDNLARYSDWVLPPAWAVTQILPVDYMNHGDFVPHGYVATPTGPCPYLIEFQGPPITNGVFGYSHAGEPHTVEWTVTTDVGGLRSEFIQPVGLGKGPVHGPMMPPNASPLACFTWDPPAPNEGDPVTFLDCSEDPDGTVVAWSWDFGDGGSSTDQNPIHSFAAGAYEVVLIVTDDDGGTDALMQVVVVGPPVVDVFIPLAEVGWHMISLPLEPVNKNILLVRPTLDVIDEGSIFYQSYLAGNDPRNRLFRIQPGVGYWTYEPSLYPDHAWYEIGVEPPAGKPHPGPWWQGFWFLVDVPHVLAYTAYVMPPTQPPRLMAISDAPSGWAWMMMGACARVPEPYNPDVSVWPATSTAIDMYWCESETVPDEFTEWWPTAACPVAAQNDAWDRGYIGLALSGYWTNVGYYTVSPNQIVYCGTPAITEDLTPGEGYWLDLENTAVWMQLEAAP